MAGGSITVHSRELCSALLGTSVDGAGRGEEEEEETKSGYPERGGRVSPVRAPSRGSTAMHIEDWLSRKARRAVVVSATVCIPYMDVLLMVHCMQALPDDADLTAIKGVCQAILEEEHRFLSVSISSLALVCCAYHRPSPSSSSLTHTQELEGFLCSEEAQDQCKREMLYRKWSERVFAPIQQRLVSQMEGPGYRELDAQRRELFNKYLSYRNRKVRFSDTWVQSERL